MPPKAHYKQMERFIDGRATGEGLVKALQQAAAVEKDMERLPEIPENVTERALRLKEIAVIELSEYIGRFIDSLNLQNAFVFVGRHVQCFADALFVIFELGELIEAQLNHRRSDEPVRYSDQVTYCCNEFIKAAKSPSFNPIGVAGTQVHFLAPSNP